MLSCNGTCGRSVSNRQKLTEHDAVNDSPRAHWEQAHEQIVITEHNCVAQPV